MSGRVWCAGVVVAALALAGCKRGEDKAQDTGRAAAAGPGGARAATAVGGEGVLLAEGAAEDLRLSADGRYASFLKKTRKPTVEGIPPQMRLGELHVVPVEGGLARRLGDGVTNVPGGLLFTPDSKHVLFLTGYNLANQSGTLHALVLNEPTAEPRRLGDAVTYFVPSPDGTRLAFVDGGVLKLGPLPSGPFRALGGEVATAGFSPDGRTLFFKRKLQAAGSLLAVAVDAPEDKTGEPRRLGDQVGDYIVAPDSQRVGSSASGSIVRSGPWISPSALGECSARQAACGSQSSTSFSRIRMPPVCQRRAV